MNLYGLDVKITPEEKPVLIEINGRNSGTDGFVLVYGDVRTQEEILLKMANKAGENGIYTTYTTTNSLTDLPHLLYGTLLWFKEIKRIRSKYKGCSPQIDWFIDHKPRLPEFSERRPRQYFVEASEKLNLDLFTCSSMIYDGKNALRVEYPRRIKKGHRGKERIRPDEVGLVWPIKSIYTQRTRKNEQMFFGPTDFDEKLVNPFPIQNFLRTKPYLHELFRETEFSDFLPQSELFGAGLTRDNYDFIETSKFVKKPSTYSQGYGVQIFPQRILRKLLENSSPKEENKRIMDMFKEAIIKRDYESIHVLIDFLKFCSSLIQEFVPSKPIHSDVTGKDHDGCMRAIVVDGKFVDAYWRLSPEPLDGYESIENLRRKYGANLEQGAIPQQISESDLEIVRPFTEKLVKALEERINMYSIKNFNKWRIFELAYWARKLREAG